jgi:hypothetical protein
LITFFRIEKKDKVEIKGIKAGKKKERIKTGLGLYIIVVYKIK